MKTSPVKSCWPSYSPPLLESYAVVATVLGAGDRLDVDFLALLANFALKPSRRKEVSIHAREGLWTNGYADSSAAGLASLDKGLI